MQSFAVGFGLGFLVAPPARPDVVVPRPLDARTLYSAFRVRLGGELPDEVATPKRAFLTSLAGTASNPLTIASWAGVFAAASVAGAADSSSGAVLLVAGVGGGQLRLDDRTRERHRDRPARGWRAGPADRRRGGRGRADRLRRSARIWRRDRRLRRSLPPMQGVRGVFFAAAALLLAAPPSAAFDQRAEDRNYSRVAS